MTERSIWPQLLYFWRLHPNLSDQSMLNCTVTGDVSWVFQYYLETRQQAWHGHHNHLTNKKYVSFANQGLKLCWSLLWYTGCDLQRNCAWRKNNSKFYMQVLDGSLKCIWKSHNFNRKTAGSFNTKAPADSAAPTDSTMTETLPEKLWYDEEINPSYSSNFAPANSFWFPKVNTALKA
jgi:hypothetical protein